MGLPCLRIQSPWPWAFLDPTCGVARANSQREKSLFQKNNHFAKQKCNFFWCMTLGLTFFKPGAPGLGPFYTLHVGWPGPTAKREKRLLPKKTTILLSKSALFFGERLAGQLPSGPPHGPSMNPLWWVTWAHPAAAQARPGQQPSPADANLARPSKNQKMLI